MVWVQETQTASGLPKKSLDAKFESTSTLTVSGRSFTTDSYS
jgi:hypothetical protein